MTDHGDGLPVREPHRPALAVSAALLGFALQLTNGFYSPPALTLVVAALAAAWAALLAPERLGRWLPDRHGPLVAVLAAIVLMQTWLILDAPIGMYFRLPMPWQHPGFVPALWIAAVAAVAGIVVGRVLRRAAAVALLGATVVLGVLTYRGSPNPSIDVVTVHDEAFAALARGESPYSMTFPDLYQGKELFYPPGMVEDGVVQYGFPYPPLSLAMAWPGQRLGDFRYAELAALILGAAGLLAAGRVSPVALLAAALLLLTPRGFFALEQSWTEPFAIAWLGLALWAASRHRPLAAAALLGLAVATKQYLVLALPMTWCLADDARGRRRVFGVACATAALATLPGLLDPRGFFHSAVMVQVREVLRMDALSLAVPIAQTLGTPLPGAVYALIVLGAAIVAIWRAPTTPSGAAAAMAVTLFTAFAFGKKAFCNYYVLVIAVLAMAIAVRRTQENPKNPPALAEAP